MRDEEWKRASTDEGIEVRGRKPTNATSAERLTGINVSDWIVYVTLKGVFKLQID